MKITTINALGEVFDENDNILGGTVNVSKLENYLGRSPTPDDIDHAMLLAIPSVHRDFVDTIWKAQQKLNNSMVRVQYYNGQIRVGAEFKYFEDEFHLRRDVYRMAADINAEVTILIQDTELDKFAYDSWPWQYGPNHGRPFTQVEVSLPAETTRIELAFNQLTAEINKRDMFEKTGVNIL